MRFGVMVYNENEWRDNAEDRWAICLPHSCDEWYIGDANDARDMTIELEQAIKEIEEVK